MEFQSLSRVFPGKNLSRVFPGKNLSRVFPGKVLEGFLSLRLDHITRHAYDINLHGDIYPSFCDQGNRIFIFFKFKKGFLLFSQVVQSNNQIDDGIFLWRICIKTSSFLVVNFQDFPRLFSKDVFQEFLGLGNTKWNSSTFQEIKDV